MPTMGIPTEEAIFGGWGGQFKSAVTCDTELAFHTNYVHSLAVVRLLLSTALCMRKMQVMTPAHKPNSLDNKKVLLSYMLRNPETG